MDFFFLKDRQKGQGGRVENICIRTLVLKKV